MKRRPSSNREGPSDSSARVVHDGIEVVDQIPQAFLPGSVGSHEAEVPLDHLEAILGILGGLFIGVVADVEHRHPGASVPLQAAGAQDVIDAPQLALELIDIGATEGLEQLGRDPGVPQTVSLGGQLQLFEHRFRVAHDIPRLSIGLWGAHRVERRMLTIL